MTTWVKVLPRERLAPGFPAVVSVDGERVLLVDLGDRIVAIDCACLRCGRAIEATIGGRGTAACPGCGWLYDLRAGQAVGLPSLWIYLYPVRVALGDVYLGCVPPDASQRPGLPPRDLS